MSKRFSVLLAFVGAAALATACAQTDAGITTKVKSRFAEDITVKAYQIDVDTKNKVVTLSGTVDSQAAKEQAVSLARNTEGVADVVDNLTVSGAAAGATSTGTTGMGTAGTAGAAGSTSTGTATGTGTAGTTGSSASQTPGPR